MRKVGILLASVLTIGAAQSAFAADLPMKAPRAPAVAPVFTWTGCYVGGYVGGAWAAEDATSRDIDGYNYGPGGGPPWSYSLDSSLIGGGTIGCNWQVGRWVWGLEGEAGYINVEGSRLDPNSLFLPLDTEARTKIGDWYAIAAARLGWAWTRTLLYVKAGVAIADVEYGVNDPIFTGLDNTIFTRKSETQAALAVGGGIEYALGASWTVKAEYMYLDFEANDTTCGVATIGGATFCWSNDFRGVHTAKFGLNYLFGPR
jgi:outer membrane immunogenic protein